MWEWDNHITTSLLQKSTKKETFWTVIGFANSTECRLPLPLLRHTNHWQRQVKIKHSLKKHHRLQELSQALRPHGPALPLVVASQENYNRQTHLKFTNI